MKKNILMVYPEVPSTYWSFKSSLRFAGKKAQFPPLGLITVAAMLPKEYDIRLVDLNVRKLTDAQITWADLVFVSAMIVQKKSFQEVVSRCKSLGKTVVAGGPYPTSSHAIISGVDYFILGEAERTLPEFIRDFEYGSARHIYRDTERPNITETPIPRFDLLEIDKYFSMMLQFSRGCPFNCEFCDIIELFGRKPRTKTPEQFIREIQAVYDTGFRGSLFVVDDNFIGNKAEVRKLLPHIAAWQKERGYPYSLFTEASVNLADDPELMDAMIEAGFDMVFLGIETPVEETLHKTQKAQNTRKKLLESVRAIQNKGLEVSAGFIVGFDTDPENIFDLQIKFIQESGIIMAMVGIMIALPNTQLYRRLEREGRLLGETSGNNTHDLDTNFITVMNKRTLQEGYKRVLKTIYNPKNYFERCKVMMREVPRRSRSKRPLRWQEIRAFLLSLIAQTISSYGLQYLRFLMYTLRRAPALFPEAVRMAIMLHHFRSITGKLVKDHGKTLRRALRSAKRALETNRIPQPALSHHEE